MKTITVENEAGERFKINEPNIDVLEGKRKPETEEEREAAEVARGFKERGFVPVQESKSKAAKPETEKKTGGRKKKDEEPEVSTSTEETK